MLTSGDPESLSPTVAGCRYTSFNPAPGGSHELVVQLVPRGSRVLEFGTATGYMSEVLRDRLGCTVTGIELVPEAAEEARSFCDRVIVGDAETIDLDSELHGEQFDAVLFADVLEHLRDPAAVLERVRPLLAEDGVVVASIPNIAHGSVRLALLRGEFRYRPAGLLDDTHLRFFTRESVEDLFAASGYVVTQWLRVRLDIDGAEIPVQLDGLPDGVREALQADRDATTYQFIVRAVPASEAAALNRLLDAADGLRAELTAARSTHAVALGRIVELEATCAELEGTRAELNGTRAELEGTRSELERVHAEIEPLATRVREYEAAAAAVEALRVDRDAARAREVELRALLLQAHTDLAQRDEQAMRPEPPPRTWKRSASLRFPRAAAVYRRARGHPS